MVTYGLNSWWKINYKSPISGYEDLYTGVILEEDEQHIKLHTIKNEIRIIVKDRIVAAKITSPKEIEVYDE